jgi:3-deoxy-D-arabino-heptulosonate 7-phosphate (DAHP) synthase
MAEDGIAILSSIEKDFGLPTVTEVMSSEPLTLLLLHVAMLQVGSRNMQNLVMEAQLSRIGSIRYSIQTLPALASQHLPDDLL